MRCGCLNESAMNEDKSKVSPLYLNPTLEAELVDMIRRGGRLEAIRRLQEAAHCSLVEAATWAVTIDRHEPTPCPYCGRALRTAKAKQCFSCNMNWHDSERVFRQDLPHSEEGI